MEIREFGDNLTIQLNESYRFNIVNTDSCTVTEFCNEGVADVFVYETPLSLCDSVEEFFAIYLKINHIELSEAISPEDLENEYNEFIPNFSLNLVKIDNSRVVELISPYIQEKSLESFASLVRNSKVAFQSKIEKLYLILKNDKVIIIEYEHE